MNQIPTETVLVKLISENEKEYLLMNNHGDQSWFPKSQINLIDENLAEIPVDLLEGRMWSW